MTLLRSKPRPAFSGLLSYLRLVDDEIHANKDGSYLAVWRIRGTDVESSEPAELEARAAQLNHALRGLGDGYEVQFHVVREEASAYSVGGSFDHPTTRLLEESRRRAHEERGQHFTTETIFTLTYRPARNRTRGRFRLDSTSTVDTEDARILERFRTTCEQLEDQLSPVFQIDRATSPEILSLLRLFITGVRQPFRVPDPPMYLDYHLGFESLRVGLNPMVGRQHLRVISMTDFPAESTPAMLDALTRQPLEYRWTVRFLPLDPPTAEARIRGPRRRWRQKQKGVIGLFREATGEAAGTEDANADNMAADATAALALASEGSVRFGYFTSTVVLFDEDEGVIEEAARETLKAIRNLGFSARIEDINAVEAYLGSLPSHGYRNVRKTLLHTLNLADLVPSTSVWTGERRSTPLGAQTEVSPRTTPLFVANTSGATPFHHYLLEGDVGNTLIQGPIGSGKSLLAVLMSVVFGRFPGWRVFYFDLGLSSFVAANAVGAAYHELTAGRGAQHGFAPLAHIDEPAELLRAQSYLELLLSLQGVTADATARREIHHALERLAQSDTRTLSALNPQSRELQEALAFYTIDGPMGGILDAEQDTVRDGRFVVYEYQDLLDRGEMISLPVIDHIFSTISRSLDGSPVLVVIDEAWRTLLHETFHARVIEWLKTFRKHNASLLFVTQDMTDLFGSGRAETILSATPTRILLPNPAAREPENASYYRRIGLNDRQLELLASAVPKREYYVVSPSGRRLFDLDLSPVEKAFYGTSRPEDIARARALMSEHGALWPGVWLEEQGLGQEANRWRELAEEGLTYDEAHRCKAARCNRSLARFALRCERAALRRWWLDRVRPDPSRHHGSQPCRGNRPDGDPDRDAARHDRELDPRWFAFLG